MNCTYCFNNNIPNHYQTGNSLSTGCKGLCFHYNLLLKKTIFKSSLLSSFPNDRGSWGGGGGHREGGHLESARLCTPHYFILSELTLSGTDVNDSIIYLLPFSYSILYSIWQARIQTDDSVRFWNIWTLWRRISCTNCAAPYLVTGKEGSEL